MNWRDARRPLRGFAGWQALAWLSIAAVIVLSLTPQAPSIPVEQGDKWGHVAAYAVVMMWLVQLYERPAHARLAWGVLALGIGLEFAQALTPYRQFDYYDMLADSLGVSIGWLLGGTAFGALLQRVVGTPSRR